MKVVVLLGCGSRDRAERWNAGRAEEGNRSHYRVRVGYGGVDVQVVVGEVKNKVVVAPGSQRL